MANFTNPYLRMASHIEQGNSDAQRRFHKEMTPQMRRLIRRAVRLGLNESPLSRRIKREAQRMGTDWRKLDASDARTIGQLAERLCQGVVVGLQNAAPLNPASDTTTGACIAETTVA